MKETLFVDRIYKWGRYVSVPIIRDGNKEISFDFGDRILFEVNGRDYPCISGVFVPQPGADVVYHGTKNGSFVFTCDDIADFRDEDEIERSAVFEVMKRLGLSPSRNDAEAMWKLLRVWSDKDELKTPQDYLDRIIKEASRFLEEYHGSYIGAVSHSEDQKRMFNLLFGFGVSRFLCATTSVRERFPAEIKIVERGMFRDLRCYVCGMDIDEYLEDFDIACSSRLYEVLPNGSVSSDGKKDSEDKWWATPWNELYSSKWHM